MLRINQNNIGGGTKKMNNISNLNKSKQKAVCKLVNTFYNEYAYLTEEDLYRLDKIDDKIFELDSRLGSIILGESDKTNKSKSDIKTIAEYTGNGFVKSILDIYRYFNISIENDISEKLSYSPQTLLAKRKQLVNERTEIIKLSKDNMKRNDPITYQKISNQINENRLSMKRGNFNISNEIFNGMVKK